jgi:hypothetical protein
MVFSIVTERNIFSAFPVEVQIICDILSMEVFLGKTAENGKGYILIGTFSHK